MVAAYFLFEKVYSKSLKEKKRKRVKKKKPNPFSLTPFPDNHCTFVQIPSEIDNRKFLPDTPPRERKQDVWTPDKSIQDVVAQRIRDIKSHRRAQNIFIRANNESRKFTRGLAWPHGVSNMESVFKFSMTIFSKSILKSDFSKFYQQSSNISATNATLLSRKGPSGCSDYGEGNVCR